MRKILSLLFLFIPACLLAQKVQYPTTKKVEVTDDYNGTTVIDPYRWLEDDNSEETKKWVKEQNEVTFKYLGTIPQRPAIQKRLYELWNYEKYSSPIRKGGYYYFFKNDGLLNQPIMYRQRGVDGKPELFLNLNDLSKEGIVAMGSSGFSKTGRYFAYSIAVAGSDWQEIFIMETATKRILPGKIQWSKFSSISWNGDDGFYYSGYEKPDEASKLSKKNEYHKVYYHKMGTTQSQDQLIYADKKNPLRLHNVSVTEDGRFLVLYITEGTSGAELKYWDKLDPLQKDFKTLIPGFASEPTVIDNKAGMLIVQTNEDAPNYQVVLIDPKNPAKGKWKSIIPERTEALQNVTTGGGNLFANYLKDASTKVVQFTYDGQQLHDIALPGIGTAWGFAGEKTDKEFFYTYTSFAVAPTLYKYDPVTGLSTVFKESRMKSDMSQFVTEQVFFKSRDGESIPMFLTYKKGLIKNGQNPVLIYGYGGFNIPITPSFSISNTFFMEQGGIYAVVNLRGGSEYGEKWHRAGMLDKKQNVFNDFICAAETLVKNKYTNPGKIAIRGGSNGGLLVGAVITQRPDLFKVALPDVGVLDMLRFHKFTIGWAWTTEYGNPDSAQHFSFLQNYSPYHNLLEGRKYPATMITTADHDDRVVPAHSFKFAARMQEYHAGDNPILIRIATNAGHGAGKPTTKMVEEATDIWSFLMYNLGMSPEIIGSPSAEDQKVIKPKSFK